MATAKKAPAKKAAATKRAETRPAKTETHTSAPEPRKVDPHRAVEKARAAFDAAEEAFEAARQKRDAAYADLRDADAAIDTGPEAA